MNQFLYRNIIFIIVVWVYWIFDKRINTRYRRFAYIVILLLFSFMVANRPTNTPDTMVYINAFNNVDNSWMETFNLLQKFNSVFEYGFVFLMLVIKKITSNYRILLFIAALMSSFLSTYGLTKIINRNKYDVSFGDILALNLTCYGLLYYGISVRAGLAIGIGLLSLNYALDKKYIRAGIFFLIAFSIHRTAFFYLIIWLALKLIPTFKERFHYIVWIVCGVLLFSGLGRAIYHSVGVNIIGFFEGNGISSSHYLYDALGRVVEVSGTHTLTFLVYGFLIFAGVSDTHYKKYLNCVMIGTIILSVFNDVTAISRAYDLFFMFKIPMYAMLFNDNTVRDNAIIRIRFNKRFCVIVLIALDFYIMLRLCIINIVR